MNHLDYEGMILTVELVTPEMAADWLLRNVSNRSTRSRVIKLYERAQRSGAWYPKPVAVCFLADGTLGNGQHTLSAIVASGIPQKLLICRNTPPESIAVMDVGLRRTINDVAHFLGSDMSGRKAAIVRILEWGPRDKEQRSFDELWEAYIRHSEVLDWLESLSVPKVAGLSAIVLAVCARAAYTEDRERIARFIEVLKTGVAEGAAEASAIKVRDLARKVPVGPEGRMEFYAKAQSGLKMFLDGVSATKIYGFTKEIFPIGGKQRKERARAF